MASRLLGLRSGELGRCMPFLLLYAVLSAMLQIGDSVSLTLFVRRVPVDSLPPYYAASALFNAILLYGYVRAARRTSSARLFHAVIVTVVLTFLTIWAMVAWPGAASQFVYGGLLIARELAYTLVIMHFGNYLPDFFSREEMDRVLPIIYAGGRLGGIAAGLTVAAFSPVIKTHDFLLMVASLGVAATLMVVNIGRPSVSETMRPESPGERSEDTTRGAERMLVWYSVASLLVMCCRWFLSFEYQGGFQAHFTKNAEMIAFLGRYTTVALGISLALQILGTSRVVKRIGLGPAYFIYSLVMCIALALSSATDALVVAVFARFVESELRLAYRNPINQLVTNRLPRERRKVLRAWTNGLFLPLGTMIAAVTMFLLQQFKLGWYIPLVGLAFGLGLAFSSWEVATFLRRSGLASRRQETEPPPPFWRGAHASPNRQR